MQTFFLHILKYISNSINAVRKNSAGKKHCKYAKYEFFIIFWRHVTVPHGCHGHYNEI